MPSTYHNNLQSIVSAERHQRLSALQQSKHWDALPVRLQNAMRYAATILELDSILPAKPKKTTILRWLESADAKRLPMLGAKTRAEAILILLKS